MSILLKLGIGAAIIALVGALLMLYGHAQYNEGVKAQQITDQQSIIKQYAANQDKLNAIFDLSSKAADAAQSASDAVGTGLASINAKYKGQTTTIIKQGVCLPSPSFVGNWNALSTYSKGATNATQ